MARDRLSSCLRRLAAETSGTLPKRPLGKTGLEVTILGLGCGALVGLKGKEHDRKAEKVIQRALDLGINYFDTAPEYGPSEARLGSALGARRAGIVLATKTKDRTRDGSLRLLEASLKALKTDHVDVWQMHRIDHMDEVKMVLAKDGALRALREAKEQGLARNIGVTGHYDPAPLAAIVKEGGIDTVLLAMNAADVHSPHSFIKGVLPEAVKAGLGVICMKVVSLGRIFNAWNLNNMRDALYYCLSLPVSTAIVGVDDEDQLLENVALAKMFKELGSEEMQRIQGLTEDYHQIANFFRKGNEEHNPFWKPYGYRSKKAAAAAAGPDVVYHGTTRGIAEQARREGLLKPGGQVGKSQWSGGPFGGHPSDPSLVYASTDRKVAEDYARQVASRAKSEPAVVAAKPEWSAAVPDEDVIADIVSTQKSSDSPLNAKVFRAYARTLGFKSPAEAEGFLATQEGKVYMAERSDSQAAQDMKDTVRALLPDLTADELRRLTSVTVAFSKPLKVLGTDGAAGAAMAKFGAGAKRLIILRGISGTGKSTVARALEREHDVKALSSDDFFMKGGRYEHNREMLPEAHRWNQARAEKAMTRGDPVVIVDNTNTQAWEMKPYVLAARRHGYSVEFREPDWSPSLKDERGRWNVDFIEQMQKSKERADIGKNVPRDILERMRDVYQYGVTEEDVLKSQMPEGIGE